MMLGTYGAGITGCGPVASKCAADRTSFMAMHIKPVLTEQATESISCGLGPVGQTGRDPCRAPEILGCSRNLIGDWYRQIMQKLQIAFRFAGPGCSIKVPCD